MLACAGKSDLTTVEPCDLDPCHQFHCEDCRQDGEVRPFAENTGILSGGGVHGVNGEVAASATLRPTRCQSTFGC